MNALQRSLIIPALLLLLFSITILSSISPNFAFSQSIWIVFGVGIFTALYFTDVRPFFNYGWVMYGIYVLAILLLIVTFIFAPNIRGNRAWIVLGPVQFQASEFVKAALILLFAYFFAHYHKSIARLRTIFLSALIVALPVGLTLLQPDLGTATVMLAIWFGFLITAGLRLKHLLIFFVIGLLAGFFGWHYFLQDYQKDRIRAVFNSNIDTQGVNYNVIQSKIAIGSAGFFGKGYKQGTQTQLGFLPEAQADFIFAAFVEEWGLLGGFIVILAFIYLIFAILRIGNLAFGNVEKFIALGTAIMLGTHFVVNIGSVTGLLPVIGIPFPFFSYGGSNLLTNFFLLGIMSSIAKRV